MNAVAFDTYRVVKRLKEAGFSETQAEAVTIAIQDSTMLDLSHLVTREHFDEKSRQTDARLDSLESRLDSLEKRLDATKAELDARIDAVESRLLTKIADTKIQLELRM
ncbi:MAG: coiled-coil domain-containing protein, partial [Rhodospirillaceae bacterium]